MNRNYEKWTEEMVAIAAGMKRAGFSSKKIAERLGVSVRAVSRRMARAGAKARLTGTGGKVVHKPGRISSELMSVPSTEEEAP